MNVATAGIGPWRLQTQRICEALIQEPIRSWNLRQLAQASGCRVRTVRRIVHQLWLMGAVEHERRGPSPDGPARPARPRQRGSRPIVASQDGAVLRDLLTVGRPQGVAGTLMWEGRENAAAVWQARRRAKGRRGLNPDEGLSLEQGTADHGGLRTWFTKKLIEAYRERGRTYLPEKRELDAEQIFGPEEKPGSWHWP